jgi:hypothetical protein
MDIVTDMVQNTPFFEVAAQGLVIANQNQSSSFNHMRIFYFETADPLPYNAQMIGFNLSAQ